MAQLLVVYHLSEEGMKNALAAGRNAGKEQVIVLRSPGHRDPEAPAEVVGRLLGLVEETKSAKAEETASLADVAKALTDAVLTLAKTLNPAVVQNVVVEDADEELWAVASSLAHINEDGTGYVRVNFDDEYGRRVVGYEVEWEQPQLRYRVDTKKDHKSFDRPMTAAEMLPQEKARRDALEVLRLAANAEAQQKQEEKVRERAEQSLDYEFKLATDFLVKLGDEHRALPEVKALAALVSACDREALQVRAREFDSDSTPRYAAERAVRKAEADAVLATKVAWVKEHGSEHLQRLTDAGMFNDSMYRNERLALEMPGWKFGSSGYASGKVPSLDDLRMLEEVRATVPDAKIEVVSVGSGSVFRPTTRFLDTLVYYVGNPATASK